ncbi:unnamed protein product [Brugia pahangi]|uniref:Secreted protein n=1 Tax=Brugia pahangi TaxID=6280 RepID=A0A0N4TF79_BRUPA|nr:unnamed protein product [Brugia pahangi]
MDGFIQYIFNFLSKSGCQVLSKHLSHYLQPIRIPVRFLWVTHSLPAHNFSSKRRREHGTFKVLKSEV